MKDQTPKLYARFYKQVIGEKYSTGKRVGQTQTDFVRRIVSGIGIIPIVKRHRLDSHLLPVLLLLASPVLAAPSSAKPPQVAKPPATNVNVANSEAKQLYDQAVQAAMTQDYPRAVTLCRKTLQILPKAAPVWGTLARIYADQKDYPNALTAVQKAITYAPKDVSYQADLADYQLRAGKRDDAEKTALKVLAVAPKNDSALSSVAIARLQAKRYADAIPILNRLQAVRGGKDRLVSQNTVASQLALGNTKAALTETLSLATKVGNDAELWLSTADMAMRTNNPTVATLAAAKMEKLAPQSPLPYYFRGRLLLSNTKLPMEQRLKQAEAQFRKGVSKAPNEALLRSQLGVTQVFQGKERFDDARKNLNAALVMNNHDPVARRGLALIAEQTNQWDDAATQYEALMKILPNDLEAKRRYAGVLIKAGRKEEAYTQFWELAERSPKNIVYLKELASFLMADKDFVKARAAYALVLERAPNDGDALTGTARCYAEENNKPSARNFYEKAIAAAPKNETNYLLLAQLYTDDGTDKGSLETLEHMMRAIPSSNAGRMMLIERYIKANRDDDAKREIAKLTLKKDDPNRTNYRLAMGNLLLTREKYTEAVAEFEKIAAEEPDNAEVLFALAGAYTKAKRPDEAKAKYELVATLSEKALTKNPKSTDARALLQQSRTALGNPDAATAFLKELDAETKDGGR